MSKQLTWLQELALGGRNTKEAVKPEIPGVPLKIKKPPFDRKKYQRDLMRKRRAEKKAQS